MSDDDRREEPTSDRLPGREERPSVVELSRQVAGPLVILAAVLLLVASAVAALTGREDVVRPELGSLPMPEGATVRYVEERCPSPHAADTAAEGPVICDAVLAVGPLDGLWIPEPTAELLVTHLEERGWQVETSAGATWLTAPDGLLRVSVEPFARVERRRPRLATAIAEGVRSHVDPDELAVLTILPAA